MSPEPMHQALRWLRGLAIAVAVLIFGIEIWGIASGGEQLDFRTFYYAPAAWQAGSDPYDPAAVGDQAGSGTVVPHFVYPPATLPVLSVLATMPFRVGYAVFLGLKLVALGVLLILWRRLYPDETANLAIFLLTVVFGYRQAVLLDLHAGNISVFEQLLLWTGVYLVVSRRYVTSGFMIAASAFFKQLTLFFLLLPSIVARSRRTVVSVLLVGGAFLGIHIASHAAAPGLFESWLARAASLDERGNMNPSSLALFRDIGDQLGLSWNGATILYALYLLILLICTVPVITTYLRSRDDHLLIVCLAFLFALAAPRMKDYSYILLLMPSLVVIRNHVGRFELRAVLYGMLWIPFLPYHSLLLAGVLFLALCVDCVRRTSLGSVEAPSAIRHASPGIG